MNVKHNKGDVIKVGIDLFRQKGYHNTGTNEIIDRSGITRGSFYNFFESKEDFAVEALEEYSKHILDLMNASFNRKDLSTTDRLNLLYDNIVESYRSSGCKVGCLLSGMTHELGGQNQQFSLLTQKYYKIWVEKIAALMKEGQQSGEIRTDVSSKDLAWFILSNYVGAITLMKAGPTQEPLDLFLETTSKFIKP